ncbi:class I SAM-dependent methyltransferase [Sphingosinicella sp.]|uniref:class I SAM-dependent methyltransferase n=1 Tax=Sphingosinicella sp. TaxID=1917971 RepID=UPI0040380BFE
MRRASFVRAVLVGALVAGLVLIAWRVLGPAPDETATAPNSFNPADFVKARPRLDAPYVVTDHDVVNAMLALAEVRPDEKVVDLGSGDGRILIAAARSHGARGLGVDIDPARIREATANAAAAGVGHRVTFRREDLFRTPLGDTDVLTLYLSQDINIRLRDRILGEMRPGARVVSHDFDMGEWRADQRQQVGTANVYLWIVPARVSGRWAMNIGGRPAVLTIDQRYQQFIGALETDGQSARIEQGRITAGTIRFILRIGGQRRIFEGRLEGNQLVGPNWRAVRAG